MKHVTLLGIGLLLLCGLIPATHGAEPADAPSIQPFTSLQKLDAWVFFYRDYLRIISGGEIVDRWVERDDFIIPQSTGKWILWVIHFAPTFQHQLYIQPIRMPDGAPAKDHPYIAVHGPSNKIVFSHYQTWMMDLVTHEMSWIQKEMEDYARPAFSHDGKRLVIPRILTKEYGTGPATTKILIYDIEKKAFQPLEPGASTYKQFPPVWSEDDRYLYYCTEDRHPVRVDIETGAAERIEAIENAVGLVGVWKDDIVFIVQAKKKGELTLCRSKWDGTGKTVLRSFNKDDQIDQILISPCSRYLFMKIRLKRAEMDQLWRLKLKAGRTGETFQVPLQYSTNLFYDIRDNTWYGIPMSDFQNTEVCDAWAVRTDVTWPNPSEE